jgi:hypothetical protein
LDETGIAPPGRHKALLLRGVFGWGNWKLDRKPEKFSIKSDLVEFLDGIPADCVDMWNFVSFNRQFR